MKNTHIIIGLAGTGIAFLPVKVLAQNEKPNIVLIIADDVSRDDFSCYGHPTVKTPNIDALANDGLKFMNMFLTTSSSSPSRSSIITGRYPHNTGACELHSPLGEEQVFFPCLLKDAGYYTAQAGKWHIGGDSTEPNGPAMKCFDRAGGSRKDGGGESGSKMWVPYLKERPKDKPFFMWFAAHDAHRSYWDKEQVLDSYDPDEIVPSPFFVNDAPTRKDLVGYYNEVSRFDYYVGEVVKELKAQNVFDNTIIIVMADNGRGFPRAKTLLLDDGIISPFVVHFPKKIKQKGAVCNSLVSVIDIAPTLLELGGAKSSPTLQGQSFSKLLEKPAQKFRQYTFAEHNWHANEAYERMICTEDYVLIENKRPNLRVKGSMDSPTGKSLTKAHKNKELNEMQEEIFSMPRKEVVVFDRAADKNQMNDISKKEKKVTKSLLSKLHQWQDETGDTLPEYLKPDRSKKKVDYLDKVEMPGASKKANLINNPGPF